MQTQSLRTICLIVMTTLAFIASNVLSDTSLMTFRMLNTSDSQLHNSSGSTGIPIEGLASATHHGSKHHQQADCLTSSSAMSSCCLAICLNIVMITSAPIHIATQITQYARVLADPAKPSFALPESVYRPPII